MRRFSIVGGLSVLSVLAVLVVLASGAASAGVVIEMDVTDVGSGGSAGTDTIYAAGGRLRMDPHPGGEGGEMSMIFRDGEMLIVDHAKKQCQTIDREGLDQLSNQLGGAMKQLQDTLDKLPPEQREMMEKMMMDRMPAGMGQAAKPRRIEKGGTEKIGDYTCTLNTLYSGDEMAWEICAGKENGLEAFDEVMESFQAMSEFTEGLRELAAQSPFGGMIDTPFSDMQKVGGVPIRVRTYSRGQLASESTLRSITSKDVDGALFEPPKGYKVKKLADELKRTAK